MPLCRSVWRRVGGASADVCVLLQALQFEGGTHIASSGALLTLSGTTLAGCYAAVSLLCTTQFTQALLRL